MQAALFGALGSAGVFYAIRLFDRIKIDDPVGAISVHGVGGIIGVLLVPVTKDVSVTTQIIGLLVIGAWVFGCSFAFWFLLKITMGIRISEQDEYLGADITECGLEAYPEFVGGRTSNII